MAVPKIKLLCYKSILDRCLYKFFDEHNDSFTRDGEGCYVLAKSMSAMQLEKFFKKAVVETVLEHVPEYDILNPEWLFVIGSCNPCDNLLLELKTISFPKKLSLLLESEPKMKYVLKEHDIKLDMRKLNCTADNVFNELFKNGLPKKSKRRNAVFIRNKRLDCHAMLKILKWIFGDANCCDVFKEEFKDKRSPIVAVNELISMHVKDKAKLSKLSAFKTAAAEVKQFIEERMKNG